MSRADVGAALARIRADVVRETLALVADYRDPSCPDPDRTIRQAVDAPARARARLQYWVATFDAIHGAGAGLAFLDACLQAAGSSETVASLNAQIATIEAQAQVLVDNVNTAGWTFEQVADWIEQNVTDNPEGARYSYVGLRIPPTYVDVWGDPWF